MKHLLVAALATILFTGCAQAALTTADPNAASASTTTSATSATTTTTSTTTTAPAQTTITTPETMLQTPSQAPTASTTEMLTIPIEDSEVALVDMRFYQEERNGLFNLYICAILDCSALTDQQISNLANILRVDAWIHDPRIEDDDERQETVGVYMTYHSKYSTQTKQFQAYLLTLGWAPDQPYNYSGFEGDLLFSAKDANGKHIEGSNLKQPYALQDEDLMSLDLASAEDRAALAQALENRGIH